MVQVSEATKLITRQIVVKAITNTIKGTSFVGIRNYVNQDGEESNQVVLVGTDYQSGLKLDLLTLKTFDISVLKLDKEIEIETANIALNELIVSLEKRVSSDENKAKLLSEGDTTMVKSKAQTDAFNHVAKGIKTKDGELYVYGFVIKKVVTKAIPREKSNKVSSLKTILKNRITKEANLRGGKYREFMLGKIETLKLQGVTI